MTGQKSDQSLRDKNEFMTIIMEQRPNQQFELHF